LAKADPSRGHNNEESYKGFVKEYEQFVVDYQAEGHNSSSSRVGTGYRSPLQLALMISPLYLFMTFRLSVKSFHRRTLVELAARLGSHKPPLISTVENLIWDAIFRLAEGHSSAYDILHDLMDSFPWSDINGLLTRGTEEWFDLAPCVLSLFKSKMITQYHSRLQPIKLKTLQKVTPM
jgi:hypothetical protein